MAQSKRHVIKLFDVIVCISDRKHSGKGKETKTWEMLRHWRTQQDKLLSNNYHTEGITMHQFPSDPISRAQWVRFVTNKNKHACLGCVLVYQLRKIA